MAILEAEYICDRCGIDVPDSLPVWCDVCGDVLCPVCASHGCCDDWMREANVKLAEQNDRHEKSKIKVSNKKLTNRAERRAGKRLLEDAQLKHRFRGYST